MSKTDAWENAFLQNLFQNATVANIGDATGLRGSTSPGQLFFALHSADPGEAATQSTNEITYTGYSRVGVARSAVGFTVTGNSVSPAANVDFGARTDVGTVTATHFSIGVASSGATLMLYKGAITPNITITQGVTPRLTTATAITED